MNILIADDNHTSCKLLRALLEAEGHSVITATDGYEALDNLERHPVDAIICDLLMPGLDGYRLCRDIRQNSRWSNVPFICYTAIYGSPNDEKLAFDLGADAYLRKPASSATILGTLRSSVDNIQARHAHPQGMHAELDVLKEYSQPLVASLEKKNFELSEQSRLSELAAEVGMALTRRDELGHILQTCTESMVKHLDAASARIWRPRQSKIRQGLRAGREKFSEGVQHGQSIISRVARERRRYQTNSIAIELDAPERDWALREGVVAFAGYPLIVEDRLVGVMALFTRKELSESAIATLARIADSLALGIQAKWAETVLRESEERFRQLTENISEVFWMTDPANKEVLYVSPAYTTIWGRASNDLMEKPWSFFDAIHPEDRSRVLKVVQAESALPYELEYRIIRPDDSIRWIRDRGFPVHDAEGSVIRIAGVAEDVTEKRQLEAELHHSQKMQAIGHLAGGVAHDFNNLLSVIFGHSEILAESSLSKKQLLESVAEINQAAVHAAGLTRQLLAFGRRQVVEPRVLDIGSLVAESRNLLRRVIGEDLKLTVNSSPALSRVCVDPGQINQVLMNLALNARDAMPQGGELTIETRDVDFEGKSTTVETKTRPGRYVLVTVADTGCGMTPEVQARIFEPFFSTKGESRGLGLSVVDGIVKQNGGLLTVASRPSVGTTISIYLPTVEEPLDEPSQNELLKPVHGKETILLVEDDDSVRLINALLLETLGYRVLQVSSAEEALELVQGKRLKIDLLFTDVIMPGMNGRKLAEAIRAFDPGIKVLFQSGYTDDIVVRHGILNREVAFLQKPFKVEVLSRKIREVFDRK
jgi:PAS domain S-box-containing protein